MHGIVASLSYYRLCVVMHDPGLGHRASPPRAGSSRPDWANQNRVFSPLGDSAGQLVIGFVVIECTSFGVNRSFITDLLAFTVIEEPLSMPNEK